jgi:hypothetical protein
MACRRCEAGGFETADRARNYDQAAELHSCLKHRYGPCGVLSGKSIRILFISPQRADTGHSDQEKIAFRSSFKPAGYGSVSKLPTDTFD